MLKHRSLETNGIRMHIGELGAGPLVVLCHGWPESWYSWRHQLLALAKAGYHAVAPDQRGYGRTDRPDRIDAYTVYHLVGDIIGLLDALGGEEAVLIGHDWGAAVVWNAALMRPDRVRAVVGLSVPLRPRGSIPPTQAMARAVGDRFYYQLYFQQEGVAESELEADVRVSLRRVLYSLSGDAPADRRWRPLAAGARRFLDTTSDADVLPQWLSEEDLRYYVGEFERTGLRGTLNWYRNLDRNWELTAPFAGAKVTRPALFIAGDRDPVFENPGLREAIDQMPRNVPNLRGATYLSRCGHWLQQEQPEQVNRCLIEFLRQV